MPYERLAAWISHHQHHGCPTGRLRLLWAEDNDDHRRLFAAYLRHEPVTIDFAEDGLTAVESWRQSRSGHRPHDIILLDLMLPVMNGHEAARTLRSEGCTLPIVMVSAHAMRGAERQSLEAGCSMMLTKPLRKQALLEGLCGMLEAFSLRAGGVLAAR